MWKTVWKRFHALLDRLEGERSGGRLLLARLPLLIAVHLAFLLFYSLATRLTLRPLNAHRWGEMAAQGGSGLLLILVVLQLAWAHRRYARGSAMVDFLGTGLVLQGYSLLGVVPDLLLAGAAKAAPLGQFAVLYSWTILGGLGTAMVVIGLTIFIYRYEAERSERRRLEALMRFTEQLSQPDEQKLLERAAAELLDLLEADSTVLYLWDEAREALVPAAAAFNGELDQTYIEQVKLFCVPRNFGATGMVFETGRPHHTGNAQKDRYAQPLPGWGIGLKSGLWVPIGEGRPIGVVRLTRPGLDKFDEADVELATSFARQVHIVLQHARALRELADLSITDHLTGLYNARHLFAVLEQELARARRYGHPLSLIMLDSDGLKQVNDRLGHQQGDQCLRLIGQMLKETLRSSDSAFRYAGDEFALILPETAAADASVLGERLRQRIAQRGALPGLEPTISVGVAAFPTHARTVEELVGAADAALYASKRGGKNRLTVALHQQAAISQMPPEQEGSPD